MLAYLSVISVPGDDLRLARIVNNPPRGIGAKSVETAMVLAQENRISLFEILDRADSFPELSRSALKMREFTGMIKTLRTFSENNTPDLLLDDLLEKSGYLRMLEEKNTVEDTTRAENVRELKTSILTYMKESGDQTLAGFLADVALYTDLDNYDKDADSVVMMTIHSAKGLEFKTVFLVGMEETIFPGLRAIGEEDEMEEERRLCYVAITRAKKKLYLSCARQRMIFGRTNTNKVSRFVDEIPEELIAHKNVPKGFDYHERRQSIGFEAPGSRTPSYKANPYSLRPTTQKAAASPAVEFHTGERVRHKAFGPGEILKMTPMGGDFLIEVSFESAGTKKLMLRAAAQHMEKLSD